jgi:hypothetical protein
MRLQAHGRNSIAKVTWMGCGEEALEPQNLQAKQLSAVPTEQGTMMVCPTNLGFPSCSKLSSGQTRPTP